MPKGKKGPTPDALDQSRDEQAPLEQQQPETVTPELTPELKQDAGRVDVYHCEADGCTVRGTWEEWNEHSLATGHAMFVQRPIEAQQPALFATEATRVTRMLNIPVSESFQNEARLNMQRVVHQIMEIEEEKKDFDADCNARLKPLKEQLRGLDMALHRDFEQRDVECEWTVSTEENARVLRRLDTGEIIDQQPLTAEDRALELEAAAVANDAQPVPPAEEVAAPALEAAATAAVA